MIKKSFNLFSFKRNYKKHWERVYKKTSSIDLGWYQPYPELSLKLINSTRVGVDGSIIDVGCGTSDLSRLLLNQGYRRLTVLDISSHAIEKVILSLGELSKKITWIEADVTNYKFVEKFDVWHDRAVFHFLTTLLIEKNM
ncbi:MAG: class I SAM-dependent methyltransferase [Desulfobacterales bacterium]|nr:class I SAM-dependent methyltransferase [Desulfobacterales bacterium]